ncbi:M42 family metallopeptidase [Clostridiaceae bacterium HSG29]|nr:M42 family metallopeptidase [Clostridiaceae bacterium HSG29]
MNNKINVEFINTVIEDLLNTPSPSGYCHAIMDKVKKYANDLNANFTDTQKGCGILSIKGSSDYTIGLSAHVDTLGAMVRSINSNGTLKFTSIGGFMMHSIEGEYCIIHTRDGKEYSGTILSSHPSVHVYDDARKQERIETNMEIRIDELVENKEDVKKLGIEVGDYISFDSRTQLLKNGFIKSRHLDDKAGVAVLFGLIKYFKENNITPKSNIEIFISTYEEVGHGSSYIPDSIKELIAIDMGAMGDDLSCKETQVSICAKDSSGPYDYNMVTKLVNLSKENKINYALDIYPHYGSDASAALSAGHNIKCALIGPGVHASHHMERTHIDGIINTLKLLISYLK